MPATEERIARLQARVDQLDLALTDVRRELRSLQHHAPEAAPEPAPAPMSPPAQPESRVSPAAEPPRAPSAPPIVHEPLPIPARRTEERPRVDLGERIARLDLLGARTLAIVGGVVTLLGIVFFFALAVNRGWIGPGARVALGGIAALLVLCAGLEARRRYGAVYAASAAVGAGIAGGYMTLLAATALYDLVPELVGLALAAGIAAVGTTIAWRWSSEVLAGIGLLGALLVPLVPVVEGAPGATGAAFAAIVFAGAAAVAIARGWDVLLMVSAAALAAQLELLGVLGVVDDRASIAVVVAGALVLLASGVARGLETPLAPGRVALSLTLGAGGLAVVALVPLVTQPRAEALALLLFALGATVVGALVAGRSVELALACAAAALVAAGVATADLLSGGTLTLAWALQAAALAWVGGRAREPRIQLAGLVYLGLAAGHAVVLEDALEPIFTASAPLVHVPGVGALALAAAVLARGPLDGIAPLLRISEGRLRDVLVACAGLATLVAATLCLVALDRPVGHVAATALWAVAGLVVVVVGARRTDALAAGAGFALSVATLVEAVVFDATTFEDPVATTAIAVAAVGLLAAGVVARALSVSERPVSVVTGIAAGIAAIGLWIATAVAADVAVLADPAPSERHVLLGWLLGCAALYLGVADACLGRPRLRNTATTLWLIGLPFLLAFEAELVEGRAVVACFAGTAAALAVAGRLAREERLVWTGAALLGATTVGTLVDVAPVDRFLAASSHPGDTAWAPLACAVAAGVVAWAWPDRRRHAAAVAAALGLYTLSLVVLELVVAISPASLETDFQRGHTVVTAVWSLIGLAVLVVGLEVRSTHLRLVGLGLFGVALAKLFLYDLSALSSVTRAAAFLAVGTLLLLGGLLVQRLADRGDDSA